MSYWTIGGFGVDVQASPTPRGRHTRAAFQRLHSGHVARVEAHRGLWELDGTIGPYTEEQKEAVKQLCEGVGETWKFVGANPSVGSRGSVPNGGGSYTINTTGGAFLGEVSVASGSYIELPSSVVPDEGWMIDFWVKEVSTSFAHYAFWGTGTNMGAAAVRGSAAGGAAATGSTHGSNDYLALDSSGNFRLRGVNQAGSNEVVRYSEVSIRPFEAFDAMGVSIAGSSVEPYALPTHKVSGPGLGQRPIGTGRTIKAEVEVSDFEQLFVSGNNQDRISIRIHQTR